MCLLMFEIWDLDIHHYLDFNFLKILFQVSLFLILVLVWFVQKPNKSVVYFQLMFLIQFLYLNLLMLIYGVHILNLIWMVTITFLLWLMTSLKLLGYFSCNSNLNLLNFCKIFINWFLINSILLSNIFAQIMGLNFIYLLFMLLRVLFIKLLVSIPLNKMELLNGNIKLYLTLLELYFFKPHFLFSFGVMLFLLLHIFLIEFLLYY